ncbi:Transposon Ty3-I Gag-Pol polyprotein [Vitis vinifera]|uniref:Transposon Ty3-I Gag-Pol polyprotein n=1 Tax=Vitis vinifera TaxID=29760 RepID=A0A438BX25_VITVI|nr:Transposon Ty3-I Gag-Pol polyprotein [Vitis vinifera]
MAVCIDYTNLNNACPKDSFPLPRIDQIVDSTAGQGMLSFWTPYPDTTKSPCLRLTKKKTTFIMPHGFYCYKVMSFGLKNTGATYQRLMTKIFKPLVGRTVEVYIDNIVVKSKNSRGACPPFTRSLPTLKEVWHEVKSFQMRLWRKCWKILGFMVSQRGIEVSPDQVKAVMKTPPLRSKKELQRLTGKLVALGRFIARFTDELRPFFLAI